MNKQYAMIAIMASLMGLSACSQEPAKPAEKPVASAPAPAQPAPAAPAAETPPAAPAAGATAAADPAMDPHKLMTAKGCVACHKVDAKLIGPAYQDVAKKYAGQKDAKAMLVKKVLEGGSGVWGAVPMPPNKAMVKEHEASALVEWILAGAK